MKLKLLVFLAIFCWLYHGSFAQFSVNVNQQMGLKLLNAGDYAKAIPYLQKTLKVDSTIATSYYHLGIAYLLNQEAGKALDISNLGLSNATLPKDALYWLKAEASLQTNALEDALSIYEYFREGKYSLDELQVKRADLDMRLEEVNLQIASKAMQKKDYQKALTHFNKSGNTTSQVLFNHAFAHFQLGNLTKALSVLQRIKDDQLKNEVQQLKAAILYQQKDWNALTSTYQQIYQKDPSVENGMLYAELLLQNNELNQAQITLGKLIQQYPRNKEPYQKLIDTYESQLDYPKKATVLKYMTTQFGYEAETYLSLAKTYTVMERYDTAQLYYDTLGINNYDQNVVSQGILHTYLKQDKLQEAEAYLLEVIAESDGKQQEIYQHDLAWVYYLQKNYQAAIVTFKQINSKARYSSAIGNIFQETGQDDTAKFYYKEAVMNQHHDPFALYHVSKNYHQRNMHDSAVFFVQKSIHSGINQLMEQQDILQKSLKNGGLQYAAMHQPVADSIEYFDEAINTTINYLIYYFPFDQAEIILSQLIKKNRSSHYLLYFYALLHYHHEAYDKALQQLYLALAQNTSHELSHLLIGKIYKEQDKPEMAKQSFERVITINQANEDAYAALLEIYQRQNSLQKFREKLEHWYQVKENELTREYLIMVYHKLELYDMAANLKQ